MFQVAPGRRASLFSRLISGRRTQSTFKHLWSSEGGPRTDPGCRTPEWGLQGGRGSMDAEGGGGTCQTSWCPPMSVAGVLRGYLPDLAGCSLPSRADYTVLTLSEPVQVWVRAPYTHTIYIRTVAQMIKVGIATVWICSSSTCIMLSTST